MTYTLLFLSQSCSLVKELHEYKNKGSLNGTTPPVKGKEQGFTTLIKSISQQKILVTSIKYLRPFPDFQKAQKL